MGATASRAKRTTLAMVSAEAGVSMATVSKVLNGRSDVSPTTRARVEQLLREHRYVPPSGRRFSPHARSIALVFDDILSPYGCELLGGVVTAARDVDLDVVVTRTPQHGEHGGSDLDSAWGRRLGGSGRIGAIVAGAQLTEAQIDGFTLAQLPLVIVDPLTRPSADVPSVGSTNWAGGVTAGEHLVGLGHRRIAYVGGPTSSTVDQARLHGYLSALSTAGLPTDRALITHGTFENRAGYAAANRLFQLPDPPTAIFAASDQIAFGVLTAARERGLDIPRDLSIVGFDDTFVAEWSSPRLTAVRQPLQEMGRVAVRTILRLADGEALDALHVELATALVVRESTAPPAGGARGIVRTVRDAG
ncbi:MAG: LacI family transcriptional regulator [Actinomycetota bacterium]|nr:LacI family transcriptional regulator [Actinomycetota bacterium]